MGQENSINVLLPMSFYLTFV